MKEQIAEILSSIATGLGTTTEMLWGALLRQAPVDAAASLIQIVVILVLSITVLRLLKKTDFTKFYDTCPEIPACVAYGLVWLLIIFSSIAFISDISNILAGFFNPEYWALKEVLNAL